VPGLAHQVGQGVAGGGGKAGPQRVAAVARGSRLARLALSLDQPVDRPVGQYGPGRSALESEDKN